RRGPACAAGYRVPLGSSQVGLQRRPAVDVGQTELMQLRELAHLAVAEVALVPRDRLRAVGVGDYADRTRVAHELHAQRLQRVSQSQATVFGQHGQQRRLAYELLAVPQDAKARDADDASIHLAHEPAADVEVVHLRGGDV